MRYIQKTSPPRSIQEWLQVQQPTGINLHYRGFTRKDRLRDELIKEQFGLCAYTGTPLDERLIGFAQTNQNLAFTPHTEHIKPRAICQRELEERGGVYGCELCEDMDYQNLVAALEVKNRRPNRGEIFGAAAHGDQILPVTPVQTNCEERFQYDAQGEVRGLDEDARTTIKLLKLQHPTLAGWRRGAIEGFLPADTPLTREEVALLIQALGTPRDGKLPEFSFCIQNYAQSLLNSTGGS